MADHRPPEPDHDERLSADLALLADDRLEPQSAADLEARAAADPRLARRIELVRAGREQLLEAAASIEAPFELRRRIGELSSRPARRRPGWLGALAGVGVAAALALVLLVAGGGGPGVTDVLDAAGRAPAAAISPAGGPLLPTSVEGVRFPDYEEKFGWRAAGRREDEIGGREVTTVFYERGGRRVAYSIVAGEALEQPDGRDVVAEGTRLRRIGEHNAVTWRRGGHTCVMSGSRDVRIAALAELAGWKAKGEIAF